MTTGLLGGTFNPPHNGHLALAKGAAAHFSLERLVLTVTGQTPHKAVGVDAETRLALTQAAFVGIPRAEVSRLDIDRPQPAYSLDTVRWAKERWGEIVFIVGGDRFADFLTWRQPNEVLRHARLGVARRPGVSDQAFEPVLRQVEDRSRVEFFPIEPLPISSSDVRRRVRQGEPIEAFVPPAVARLIDELGLYR